MSDSTGSRHDPLAALRQRDFRWFSFARFASAMVQTSFQAALGWQVWELTHDARYIAYLGLVRFVPQLIAALYAGAFADAHDRKRIVLIAQCVPAICASILLAATITGALTLPLIYGLVVLIALAAAFDNPARQSLLPSIVPTALFQNAITVSSTLQSLAGIIGFALQGVLIARFGIGAVYGAIVVLLVLATGAMATLRPRPVSLPSRAVSWAAIREGVAFVRHRQPLLGSMTLDMFAVVFGGAQAMLPIYATDILLVGPVGFGILSAALPAGAMLMSVVMVAMPPVERTGRTLLLSVAAFGVATMAFGAARWFPLSVLAYMGVGMADQLSVVMRQTTIQLSTPDHLRGRVTAVAQLFIGASNQLGAVESGFLAAATSATFAVVSGGAACLAVVGAVAASMPELRRYTMRDVLASARRDRETSEAAGG